MIITKKHLPRRSFLRGAVGTMVALPFLDAMVPALSAQSKARPFRFGAIYVPNGIYPQLWHPDTTGSDFEFKSIMAPLEPYRDYLVTISQMKAPDGNPEMGGVHMGASAAWLNGVGPTHRPGKLYRHPIEEDHRPVHRRQGRRRYAAPISPGGNRGHGNLRGRLRRLSMCLLQHRFMARRHQSAAHGYQPACDFRTHVRRNRFGAKNGFRTSS